MPARRKPWAGTAQPPPPCTTWNALRTARNNDATPIFWVKEPRAQSLKQTYSLKYSLSLRVLVTGLSTDHPYQIHFNSCMLCPNIWLLWTLSKASNLQKLVWKPKIHMLHFCFNAAQSLSDLSLCWSAFSGAGRSVFNTDLLLPDWPWSVGNLSGIIFWNS